MIKQLQLRGISRNPSDRYTSDGGCAESLNVFLDNDETAPALKPVVVNDKKDDRGIAMFPYPDWGYDWEAVFIHKAPTYERAVIKYVDSGTTKLGVWNGTGCTAFLSLAAGENFIRCISLGNSLGVVTDKGTYWVLMKDNAYKLLGTSIPFPSFTIANFDVTSSDTAGAEVERQLSYYDIIGADGEPQPRAGFDDEHLTKIWEEIDLAIAKNAKQGVYNRQQFAIFAIRLYDNTRIISTPVLLTPGYDNPYVVSYEWREIVGQNTRYREKITVTFNAGYKIFAKLNEDANFFNDWGDVVDAIEIYLSPQIEPDRKKSEFDEYEDVTVTEAEIDGDFGLLNGVEGNLVLGSGEGSVLSKYLEASNFYRVYEINLNDTKMANLRNGMILDTTDYMFGEDLVTRGIRLDTLSDMKHYEVAFTRATLYNNKILASGITETVELGLNMPIATYFKNPSLTDDFSPTYTYSYSDSKYLAYRMTFLLRDSSGRSFSVKATNGSSDYFFFGPETINSTSLQSNAYGMIICPDPRAYAVKIQAFYDTKSNINAGTGTAVGVATLNMTEHPNLDCSYWYGDIEAELVSSVSTGTYTAGASSYSESLPNKIYASEMDNPFVFPTASRYTLQSKVLGCAIATEALSTGQFGQFPIYVFTEEGIWVMESASDGTIVSTKPMSREVCTNADSITPIDNAVVFMTEKAVMLVVGSQITNISPFMNGKHYLMDATSREGLMVAGSDWSEFSGTLADTTHFMAFMESASIAYDYKGSRLVFINEEEKYQYVYMLKTNTWHKMYVDGYGEGPNLSRVMNAYPDSYVNVNAGSRYVWDLSTKLDVTSSTSIKGVIVTRPFDLDAPDVRKSINDIRIRGAFNRRDVRYILMGSMDGINWGVLPSLHGGSYKWFRLILLTNLSPTERISWIDVDYDVRFNNKLR